jgi:hypothetical protein
MVKNMQFRNIHYDDHDKYFEKIKVESHKVKDQLTFIRFDYSNKISGKLDNKNLNGLLNSISFRLSSVLYHYQLLSSINIHGKPRKNDETRHPIPSQLIANKQDFIFDSIIFNTVSLFDYVAKLISFLAFKKNQNQFKAITGSARNHEIFKNYELAKIIVRTFESLFNKLNQYRGTLIHDSDDFTNFDEEISYFNNTIVFKIYAPTDFRKYFKKELQIESSKPDINSVSLWLILYSIMEIQKIFIEIRNYIELTRIIPSDKEIIL